MAEGPSNEPFRSVSAGSALQKQGSGDGQTSSPAFIAFTKVKPDLVEQLSFSFVQLKDQCQAAGLITFAEVQATLGGRGATPAGETSLMLEIVLSRIRTDPSLYDKFMSLPLLQDPVYGNLVTRMGKLLEDERAEQQRSPTTLGVDPRLSSASGGGLSSPPIAPPQGTTKGIILCPNVPDDTLTETNLLRELRTVTDWFPLGLLLSVSQDALLAIQQQYSAEGLRRVKGEMISQYLNTGQASWKHVIAALRDIGRNALADRLEAKYIRARDGTRPPEELLDELAEVSAIARESSRMINGKFASLVTRACRSLRVKKTHLGELKLFIFQVLGSNTLAMSDIDGAATVDELFRLIAKQGLWSYLDYDLLERVIREFSEGDERLQGMLEDYQQQLSGFKLSTLLDSYIQFVQPEDEQMQQAAADDLLPKRDHDPALFKRLMVKTNAEITDHSLDYVYELRKRVSRFMSLPPIVLVLDKIAEGCVCVTWRIPAEFTAQVIRAVQENKDRVDTELGALTITVGNEQIYHNPVEEAEKQEWLDLFKAAGLGRLQTAAKLIKTGVNVNRKDEKGWTALHYACQNCKLDLVELLVNSGADLGAQNQNGVTPLHMACQNGHTTIVSLLLKSGADLRAVTKVGYCATPLMLACGKGHGDVVDELLATKSVDLDQLSGNGKVTALILASKNGHLRVFKKLIKAGATVELQTKDGVTALHVACQEGHRDIVSLLWTFGADAQALTKMGNRVTPLMLACLKGHGDVVDELLATKSVNLDQLSGDGLWTALIAASESGHLQMVKKLIKAGVTVKQQNKDGKTALEFALDKGHEDIVQALLEHY